MADSDSAPSPPMAAADPLASSKKENITPVSAKIAELNESRSELLTRIQSLKQGWRSKLDTQVKIYRDELSDLKQSLNVEVEQLRSDFQELRTTLQQQQEDVTASLRKLGLQDVTGDAKEVPSNTDAAKEPENLEDKYPVKEETNQAND